MSARQCYPITIPDALIYMHSQSQDLSLRFVESIESIGKEHWNQLTGTHNPFMRYEFLQALEKTGCTTRRTGWQPHHVAVFRGDSETPVAVMPLYLKTNSWGEYVFDWSWANAYQSYGFDYYPKFVTAAPFTPSFGARFFVDTSLDKRIVLSLIAEKTKEKAELLGASSWHILFPTPEQHELLSELELQPRIATQFHWHNRGYESFDEFLAALNSRKRKSIRRERKQVSEQDFTFIHTEGADITEQQWADFYLFYQSTYLVRGMQGYLKLNFFRALAESMPEQLLMVNVEMQNATVAAALFFKNDEKLFGRYWGCREEHQFLHFETCYYQGLDYAIAHRLSSFDAGAQGEHKIQRGFEPITTYSNHWIANQAFSEAIADFLRQEKPNIAAYQKEARSLLPFRQADA